MTSKKETNCSRIKQSWHAIARMYNNEAIKHNLTTTIGFVLLQIDHKDGVASTSIGPSIGMEPTSLTRTINQMEEKGLIVRKRDKKDARRVMIVLTEKGKAKREISKKAVKTFNEQIEKKIGTAKLKIFCDVINEINSIADTRKSLVK
ncbi:MAG: MarR family winged helix-turn-helix transcriptional regulator [Bacteroidetes bacterium]|jgi:DNA-binding MarR family transcriptional regulator|nr:MarR family winged helix-turn-helix transcriptional regulator [Bacteroidota bacterium]